MTSLRRCAILNVLPMSSVSSVVCRRCGLQSARFLPSLPSRWKWSRLGTRCRAKVLDSRI
nr:MAG TPA: hypothetical protein [Caudoviricetes sp.]